MPNPHAVRVTLARRPESDDKVWYPVPADIADQLRGFGWAVVEVMPVFEHKTALEVERRRTGLALGIVEKIEAEVADARKADAEATENVEWSGIDLDAVDEWAKQLRASLDAGESGQLQADPGSSKGLDREALTHDECEALLKLIAQARDEADPDFEMPPALRSAQLRLRGGASGLPVEPSRSQVESALTEYFDGEWPPEEPEDVVDSLRSSMARALKAVRVDAQPEREDGEVEAPRAMLAEARKESGDAQIERDEARAEVERLNIENKGLEGIARRLQADLPNPHAKPLTTDVLRNPPDALVLAYARAVIDERISLVGDAHRDRILRDFGVIADHLDSLSPPSPSGLCSVRSPRMVVGGGEAVGMMCELPADHAGDHRAGETRWGLIEPSPPSPADAEDRP